MEEKGLVTLLHNWKETILVVGLAAFFGVVRYAQDFVVDAPPQFKWIIACAKTITAAAAGLLSHWLCREWDIGPNMTAVMVATAGYGGAEALNFFKQGVFNAITQLTQSRK